MHAVTLEKPSSLDLRSGFWASRRLTFVVLAAAIALWVSSTLLVGFAGQPAVDQLIALKESSDYAVVDTMVDFGIDAIEVAAAVTGNEVASAHELYEYRWGGCSMRTVYHRHWSYWYYQVTGYSNWYQNPYSGAHCIGA